MDAFHDIRRRGMCLFISTSSVDEAAAITRELGPDGLMLSLPGFESEDHARAAIERIEAAR